jgi:hypothetical protein
MGIEIRQKTFYGEVGLWLEDEDAAPREELILKGVRRAQFGRGREVF